MPMESDTPVQRATAAAPPPPLRWAARVAVVAVPAGLWFGGAQPVAVGLIPSPWDKLAHVAVFAVLAAAIGLASGQRGGRLLALALAGAVLVGWVDEWHQTRLPGRNAGWDDFAADAAGALLGAWLTESWLRRSTAARRAPSDAPGR